MSNHIGTVPTHPRTGIDIGQFSKVLDDINQSWFKISVPEPIMVTGWTGTSLVYTDILTHGMPTYSWYRESDIPVDNERSRRRGAE